MSVLPSYTNNNEKSNRNNIMNLYNNIIVTINNTHVFITTWFKDFLILYYDTIKWKLFENKSNSNANTKNQQNNSDRVNLSITSLEQMLDLLHDSIINNSTNLSSYKCTEILSQIYNHVMEMTEMNMFVEETWLKDMMSNFVNEIQNKKLEIHKVQYSIIYMIIFFLIFIYI
jgi:hypothetical protein